MVANIKGKAKQTTSVERKSEGSEIEIRTTRDGALVSVPWYQALVLEGRVFLAYYGSASTAVTLDASWANTDPDISIDVPDGITILPLVVDVVMEAYGSTALFETMTLCSKTLGAKSAGTAFTPINLNTRSGYGSDCLVYTAPTITSGYTTGAFEIYRACVSKIATLATGDDDSSRLDHHYTWSAFKEGFAPVLQGEASLSTWATAQTTSGYLKIIWAELPSAAVE